LVSALGVSPSTRLLSGALVWRRASVGFARRRKARGMWLPSGSVITLSVIRRGEVEVCGLSKDAGVMVPSDPS
jgi:hypothetical protein